MDPLRIVIMSATLQAELFSEYFDDVPVYVISGRTFPVDVSEKIRSFVLIFCSFENSIK